MFVAERGFDVAPRESGEWDVVCCGRDGGSGCDVCG